MFHLQARVDLVFKCKFFHWYFIHTTSMRLKAKLYCFANETLGSKSPVLKVEM